MFLRWPRTRTVLIGVCGRYKTGWKEAEHQSNMENTTERRWFGRTNIIPWPWLFGLHSKRMSNKQRYCGQLQGYVWIQDVSWTYRKYRVQGNLMQTSMAGPMMWKVMQRNAWSDITSWRTKHHSNCTKLQLHVLMTINPKKKNWDLLEICQKYALKLSWNACIWHALEDLIFYGL